MTGFDFTLEGIIRAFDALVQLIGVEWFEAKTADFKLKSTTNDQANYAYLYQKPRHPLINWYLLFPTWKAECERAGLVFLPYHIISLALLGQSLEKIRADKKFNSLINRLKQPDDFYATAWEIEVAASYIAQGLKVQFIEEQTTRTPDLYITDGLGNSAFWIECKNRDTENDKETQDVWQQIEKYVLQYLDTRRLNYQIVLTAHEKLKSGDASRIRRFIVDAIERKFEPPPLLRLAGATGTFADDTGKFVLTFHKLSEPDVRLDATTFTLPLSRDHIDFGTFVCDKRDLYDGKTEITNPRAVQLVYSGDARVQGVQSAFKSAVKQLPETGPGVIHIRLPINSWVTDFESTKSQVESYLRRELSGNQNRRVNAVIVAIHYTELVQDGAFQYPQVRHVNLVVEHSNPRA